MIYKRCHLDRREWHLWYAWRPVIVDSYHEDRGDYVESCQTRVWRQYVWRKRCYDWGGGWWEYKI